MMKLTKSQLKEMIKEVIKETKAQGYDDPAYRAAVEQFKGKKVSKDKFAQALAMHHDSMDETTELKETVPMGKMDRVKFMKYFDLALKTAGTDPGNILRVLKQLGLAGKDAVYTAKGISTLVSQMAGGGE